ncbi:MAG TPA: amidohydrolase family protein, partial [Chthonomonadaceae bacterium]|nr:amidohydrolase family protein [Chthonomonadaceae bacterium]
AHIIDATADTVIPGLVAAASDLGDRSDALESIAPDYRALDGYNAFADQRTLLERGVTTAYVAPGSRRLVRGQGAVVKLSGEGLAARALRSSADISISLGAVAKSPPAIFKPPIPPTDDNPILPAQRQLPSVGPSEFALLRQLFADARAVAAGAASSPAPASVNVAAIAAERNPMPGPKSGKLRALAPILDGRMALRVHADTAGDIRRALELADAYHLRIVLEGGTEAYQVADELARRQIPVVVTPPLRPALRTDLDIQRPSAAGRVRLDAVASLVQAGVAVSLAADVQTERADLLGLAAIQVGYGVPRDAALRLITLAPARALGVEGRVGSLEPGKDADLLVLSGDPFDTMTQVEMTMVSGAVVYRRAQAEPAGQLTAIRAGRIQTVTQGVIDNGMILVRAGKIVAVRRGVDVPEGAVVVDASHSTVMPGILDAGSFAGLHADALEPPIEPTAAQSGPASGRTKLLDALAPADPAFADALRAGVTALLLSPPAGGTVCGVAALIKTAPNAGRSTAGGMIVVKADAALCFNFLAGGSRRTQPWAFRELLQTARSYNQRRIQYNQDHLDWERDRDAATKQGKSAPKEPVEVPLDEDQEPFAPLFRGTMPAFVRADRADEILNALKVFRDELDLPMALVEAPDSFRVSDEIRKRGVAVALGPDVTAPDRERRVSNAATLARAGVPVLFQSASASGAALLRMNAAEAVRSGMDPVEALRALTIYPARVLRVDHRLGSIEAGKDADLVFLDGDALSLTSRVERVMVGGKVVYDGTRR